MKIQAADSERVNKPAEVKVLWSAFALATLFVLLILVISLTLNALLLDRMLTYVDRSIEAGVAHLQNAADKAKGKNVEEVSLPKELSFAQQAEDASFESEREINGRALIFTVQHSELGEDPNYIPSLNLHPEGFIYSSIKLQKPGTLISKKFITKLPFAAVTETWKSVSLGTSCLLAVSLWVLLLYVFRSPLLGGKKEL